MVFCKQAVPEPRKRKCNKIHNKKIHHNSHSTLDIMINIEEGVYTKFLGLYIDNHLNWKNHINQLNPKLSRACCAVRFMLHISNTDTLKTIYFAHFHSLIKYRIILGGNSDDSK
jgi:hypothetical protein